MNTFNTASEISGKCFDSFVNYEINGSINCQLASPKPRLKSIIFVTLVYSVPFAQFAKIVAVHQ